MPYAEGRSGNTASPIIPPPSRLVFLMLPDVHVMDLAGPLQVFHEANGMGARYTIHHCATGSRVRTAQGLVLSDLEPLPDVHTGDRVLVPGIESSSLDRLGHVPVDWLRRSRDAGAEVGSICSGAFVLAHAGLLDARRCTTHWKLTELLQRRHPRARVLRNRLFVADGNIVTSAGLTAGIDTALWLLERDHGPIMAARVAREMVVYLRRDPEHDPDSIYLDYRSHLHPGVHRIQDWLIAHPDRRPTISDLAGVAGMSPRNVTRVFRQATGVTLKNFANRLKLEVADALLRNRELTVERVASECGFTDARQLRRLYKRKHGGSPSKRRSLSWSDARTSA